MLVGLLVMFVKSGIGDGVRKELGDSDLIVALLKILIVKLVENSLITFWLSSRVSITKDNNPPSKSLH